jgi:hypothetical protein
VGGREEAEVNDIGGRDGRLRKADRAIDAIVAGLDSYNWRKIGTICHYTNADGFYGMLRTRRIWATSAARMGPKDTQEMQHAEEFIEQAFDSVARKRPDLIRRVRAIRSEHSVIHHDSVGIACFTTKKNSDRHWREHGRSDHGTAFCVELRFIDEKIRPPSGLGVSFLRVRYDGAALRESVRDAAMRILLVDGNWPAIDAIRVTGLARIADIAAVCFKEPTAYSWEHEHRMVAIVAGNAARGWWITSAGKPHLELQLRANDQPPALASVLIKGPQEERERAECFLRNEVRYGGTTCAGPLPPMPPVDLA